MEHNQGPGGLRKEVGHGGKDQYVPKLTPPREKVDLVMMVLDTINL